MSSGMAMRMKLELSRYKRSPPSFTPPPLLDPVDHDVLVEGYCAPATIDRELMKFAPYCWSPLPEDIPLLYKHDPNRVAGRILSLHTDDSGLFVKARVSDPEARRCSFFSVAATVRAYKIYHPDDDRLAHALIIDARLDEVSITNSPANLVARILYRDRPEPAALKYFDLMSERVRCAMKQLELIEQISRVPPPAVRKVRGSNATSERRPAPPSPSLSPQPKAKPRRPAVEPYRVGSFGQLVAQMERNHHG